MQEDYEFQIDGIDFKLSTSSNPFGERYIIVSANDQVVSGISFEKKKSGEIEIKNKVTGSFRLTNGKGEEVKAAATPSRTL